MGKEIGGFYQSRPLPESSYSYVEVNGETRRFVDAQALFEEDRYAIGDELSKLTREQRLEDRWEMARQEARRSAKRLGIL